MRCVNCGKEVDSTFRVVAGDSVRLLECPHCQNRADPYFEVDNVIKFLDLLLHDPKVYRHVIFNKTLSSSRQKFSVSKEMYLILLAFFSLNLQMMEHYCISSSEVCEGQRMFFFTLSNIYFEKTVFLRNFLSLVFFLK